MPHRWLLMLGLGMLAACREQVIVGHDVRLPISIPDRKDAGTPVLDAAPSTGADADPDDEMLMMQDENDSSSDVEQNEDQTEHD